MHFSAYPGSEQISVVTFEPQVFGGPQAVEFSAKLNDFASRGGRWVIVDLTNVELMNSSGLGMLVGGMTTMRKYNGAVKLVAVPEKVSGLLRITRLNTVFESYSTVEEAVLSCRE